MLLVQIWLLAVFLKQRKFKWSFCRYFFHIVWQEDFLTILFGLIWDKHELGSSWVSKEDVSYGS